MFLRRRNPKRFRESLEKKASSLGLDPLRVIDLSDHELVSSILDNGRERKDVLWHQNLKVARATSREGKKVLKGSQGSRFLEKLLWKEAGIYQRLMEHPQIPTLFGVGFHPELIRKGSFYLVLEDVGPALAEVLSSPEEMLEEGELTTLALSLLEVLGYLHSKGVIHGDIKIENVSFTYERAFLFDFGISRIVQNGESSVSLRGEESGSYWFTHHSQMLGIGMSFRTDLFALGRTLYFAAVGETCWNTHVGYDKKLDSRGFNGGLRDLILDLTSPDLEKGPRTVDEALEYLQ